MPNTTLQLFDDVPRGLTPTLQIFFICLHVGKNPTYSELIQKNMKFFKKDFNYIYIYIMEAFFTFLGKQILLFIKALAC